MHSRNPSIELGHRSLLSFSHLRSYDHSAAKRGWRGNESGQCLFCGADLSAAGFDVPSAPSPVITPRKCPRFSDRLLPLPSHASLDNFGDNDSLLPAKPVPPLSSPLSLKQFPNPSAHIPPLRHSQERFDYGDCSRWRGDELCCTHAHLSTGTEGEGKESF